MKTEEMKTLTDNILEKIGKDASGMIADDIATLISDNAQMNTNLENRDNEISKLKEDKERLITTNGNLLQQISVGTEPKKKEEQKEETKPFSFKKIFDEKGKFIKN